MNGIVINIDPVIAQIGPFELRWYSLAIICAVLAAIAISAYRAQKKGIPTDVIYSLAVWIIVAGIVGARLFHVIDRFSYYASNPSQIFQFQQGGLAIWGALLCGIAAAAVYARIKHIPLAPLFDVLVPAILVAQIIGRVGCIVNGDAYGAPTGLPWGFIYIHPNALIPSSLVGIPTHPYPVYEMLWNVLGLLIIWRLSRVFKRDGLLFMTYLSLYAVGRFLLTFVREEQIWFWGLQEAQVIAILILVASVIGMLVLKTRPLAETAPEIDSEQKGGEVSEDSKPV